MKINVADKVKVQAALDAVNKRASVHVLSPKMVAHVADRAGSLLLARGLAKTNWVGITVDFVPEGPGKAYAKKSQFFTTNRIGLQRFPAGWFLVKCIRYEPWSDAPERLGVTISPVQADLIRKAMLAPFTIAEV